VNYALALDLERGLRSDLARPGKKCLNGSPASRLAMSGVRAQGIHTTVLRSKGPPVEELKNAAYRGAAKSRSHNARGGLMVSIYPISCKENRISSRQNLSSASRSAKYFEAAVSIWCAP
jgi:hypothetical protein